jgi:hypothetical protein
MQLFAHRNEVLDETEVESIHRRRLLIRRQLVLDLVASGIDPRPGARAAAACIPPRVDRNLSPAIQEATP